MLRFVAVTSQHRGRLSRKQKSSLKIWLFLFISQQGVSAGIIQNSAIGNFPPPPKQKEQRQKQLGAFSWSPHKFGSLKIGGVSFFLMFFPFLYILNIMQYLYHES
jgi:hypothetical protein